MGALDPADMLDRRADMIKVEGEQRRALLHVRRLANIRLRHAGGARHANLPHGKAHGRCGVAIGVGGGAGGHIRQGLAPAPGRQSYDDSQRKDAQSRARRDLLRKTAELSGADKLGAGLRGPGLAGRRRALARRRLAGASGRFPRGLASHHRGHPASSTIHMTSSSNPIPA